MALAYYLNSIQPLLKLRVLILTALLIFLLSKILVSVLKPSIAIICLRLMSFFRIYLADYYIFFCLRFISVSARYCIPQCVRLIAGGGGVDWAESTTGYTFTPCVGSFTSPGIDTR